MIIELKRRDHGHTKECWKMDLGEKAALIDPGGNAVVELEPAEALSCFRMPSLEGDSPYLRIPRGDDLLTFFVHEDDLRQIEHFLNLAAVQKGTAPERPSAAAPTPLASRRVEVPRPGRRQPDGTHAGATGRGRSSSVKAVAVSLIVLAGLAAFAYWRSMGPGPAPASARAKEPPASTSRQYTPDQGPHTPDPEETPAPPSGPQIRPRPQNQSLHTTATPRALVLREEATAIDGLRECALVTGRYPESLVTSDGHLTQVIRQLRENPLAKVQSTGLDPGPARTSGEKIVHICRLMSFYTFLRGDRREPAYFGNVVKPGEADRVLLRWRLGPKEYRVIYGDLHAETVTAER